MDRIGALAVLALVTIATAVGGAVVRLALLLDSAPAVATIVLVAGVLVGAATVGIRSRPNGRTVYWE